MRNFEDYKVWCVKLKDNTQVYFLSKTATHLSLMDSSVHLVLFPMTGSINDVGSMDFDQYVDYSSEDVVVKFDDIRAVTIPSAPIEKLYRQSVRRILFLHEQPEYSKRILQNTMNELKLKFSDGKITATDYRNEILRQTDKMIRIAEGEEIDDINTRSDDGAIPDVPNEEHKGANIIDFSSRKPPSLH